MENESLRQIYIKFAQAKGNQFIASEYAIKILNNLIRKFKTENILEIGLGIGSIAGTLIKLNKSIIYTGTENNAFCLNALRRNLNDHYQQLQIFNQLQNVPTGQKYELIIIDGKDDNLEIIRGLISGNGIIAIEGDREDQLKRIRKLFPRCRIVHSISLSKNKSYSPFSTKAWQGGIRIIFIDPTILQNIWWMKEKLFSKIKYQVRYNLS